MWTPTHPTYESVEVMAKPHPDRPEEPLVWAFFTERAGDKNQVHYLNDSMRVEHFEASGGEAYYRPIDYQAEGPSTGAKDLTVSFDDRSGEPVSWTVRFGEKRALTKRGAGLTNQSGHAAERIFLLFYRGENAITTTSSLTIGGEDFSFPDDPEVKGQFPFQTAYSSNVYVASVVYGTSRFAYPSSGRSSEGRPGRIFRPVGPSSRFSGSAARVFESPLAGTRDTAYLVASEQGELKRYEHREGRHAFRITFDPPLPPAGRATRSTKHSFCMSLDSLDCVVSGTLSANRREEGALSLKWRPRTPKWTRNYSFRSQVQESPRGRKLITEPME